MSQIYVETRPTGRADQTQIRFHVHDEKHPVVEIINGMKPNTEYTINVEPIPPISVNVTSIHDQQIHHSAPGAAGRYVYAYVIDGDVPGFVSGFREAVSPEGAIVMPPVFPSETYVPPGGGPIQGPFHVNMGGSHIE